MRFEIVHEISYHYSKPVFFEPHTFFLRPREDAYHRLVRFEMKIDPEPLLQWAFPDIFGNNSSRASFQALSDFLKIRIESDVETAQRNPFDYLLEESCLRIPSHYREETRKNLAPYFYEISSVPAPVKEFSGEIAMSACLSTTQFLTGLCQAINVSFKKIYRGEGDPWPGVKTLERKEGSCRDLTALFMECCRAQGLAARFTSGYYFTADDRKTSHELHAWPEVYLEGAGWRGFDPTVGLACGEFHVPLASANKAGWVSPVQGSFRGDGVTSIMDAQVQISKSMVSAV